MTACTFLLLVCLLCNVLLFKKGEAYPFGPPDSSCIDGLPHHLNDKLAGPSPYIVWVDQSSYMPSDIIKVTVSSVIHRPFRGIVARAHVVEGERLQLLGEFLGPPPNGTRLISWYAEEVGKKSCLVHSDASDKYMVTLAWKAPPKSYGDLRISVDLVEDFERTWADHYIILKAGMEKNISTSFPYEVKNVDGGLDKEMHWSECGSQRGCVLYPDWCSGDDCQFAASYRPIQNGQYLEFEVMGGADDYVSVGFSEDEYMGGTDSGFACIMTKYGEANFLHGLMPDYYFVPHIPIDYHSINVQRINSRIYCRFIRPVNVTVPYQFLKQPTGSDLTIDYYISLAFGHVYKGSTSIHQHTVLPLISKQKTNVLRPNVIRLSGLTPRIKAHGVLNSVAWFGMIGIGSVFARHYRNTFQTKLGGKDLWFQVHRGLQITGVMLSAIGTIVMFTIGWTKKAPLHAILGLVATGLLLLQAVVPFFRPSPDSPRRPIFNVVHRLMALVTMTLAVATAFLGVKVDIVLPSVTENCTATISVILVIYLIWYMVAMFVTSINQDDKGDDQKAKITKWVKVERMSLLLGILGVLTATVILIVFIIMA